jgi:hypothetical protein
MFIHPLNKIIRSVSNENYKNIIGSNKIYSPTVEERTLILRHVDPLLGNDSELSKYTRAVTE